jgi:hypothetical protein
VLVLLHVKNGPVSLPAPPGLPLASNTSTTITLAPALTVKFVVKVFPAAFVVGPNKFVENIPPVPAPSSRAMAARALPHNKSPLTTKPNINFMPIFVFISVRDEFNFVFVFLLHATPAWGQRSFDHHCALNPKNFWFNIVVFISKTIKPVTKIVELFFSTPLVWVF